MNLERNPAKVVSIMCFHDEIDKLVCLHDQPQEAQDAVVKKMEEMDLPEISLLMETLYYEGAKLLACPLNLSVFDMSGADLVLGVTVADPATYYKEVMMAADINLAF
ncbi:MAG: DsrE/DsrF/DrsH-like family protein [Thermoleophilia bacterium]